MDYSLMGDFSSSVDMLTIAEETRKNLPDYPEKGDDGEYIGNLAESALTQHCQRFSAHHSTV